MGDAGRALDGSGQNLERRYHLEVWREALLHVLLLETSCFRYWGQGTWTDYAREIHRRGEELLNQRTATTPTS